MDINFILSASALFFGLLSLTLAIWSHVRSSKWSAKLSLLLGGKKAGDLESVILQNQEHLKLLDKEVQDLFEISNKLHKLSSSGLHKFGVLRFNPFKDIGGDQSFAIALLDGRKNGLVISSLHTREGTRVYAKPIELGGCKQYTLTEEEQQAIRLALVPKSEGKM